MEINSVLSELQNVKKAGNHYTSACPVCGDDHHLYIKEADEKILMYCQKCSAKYPEIMSKLSVGTRELVPHHKEPDKIVEQYDHIYNKVDGTVDYYKTRTKYLSGKKKFAFYYYENNKKIYSKPKNCNNLYNIDKVNLATYDVPLYIVEGEKCADALIKLGLLATTSNTGAGNGDVKLSKVDTAILDRFQTKIVIPDNDEAGQKYAKAFQDLGARVLPLSDIWADILPKQDIADYIKLGKPMDDVLNYTFIEQKEWKELDKNDLISEKLFARLLAISDAFERTQAITHCRERARELKSVNQFNQNFKQYQIKMAGEKHTTSRNSTNFSNQPLSLSCGDWVANDYGVKKSEINVNNGAAVTKMASPIPILPTSIIQNINTGIEKIQLSFYKSGWKAVCCERSKTANKTKIIELADNGVEVNSENASHLVRYIADCVALNLDTIPHQKAVSRVGWVGKEFMPYTSDICFDGEKENKHLFEAISQKGDFGKWTSYVSSLRKNLLLRMQMAVSFASPLIERVIAI